MKVAIVNLSARSRERLVVRYDSATFVVPRGGIHLIGNVFPRDVKLEVSNEGVLGSMPREGENLGAPQIIVADQPKFTLRPDETGPEM